MSGKGTTFIQHKVHTVINSLKTFFVKFRKNNISQKVFVTMFLKRFFGHLVGIFVGFLWGFLWQYIGNILGFFGGFFGELFGYFWGIWSDFLGGWVTGDFRRMLGGF
jgi:hypothetical protein